YSSGSYYHHLFWLLVQSHGFAVTDYLFIVNFQRGKLLCTSSGGYDDMVSSIDCLLPLLVLNFYLFARFYPSPAFDLLNLVFSKKKLNAFAHAVSHASATVDHVFKVGFYLPYTDTIISGVIAIFKHLCAGQQGLGGDTAPVETDPSSFRGFKDGSLQPQLASTNGCYPSTSATAYHNNINFG